MQPNIYDLDGFRYSFQEIEGWPRFLYSWLGLRTATRDERCAWIEGGTAERFARLIEHLNQTHRNFVFEALVAEAI